MNGFYQPYWADNNDELQHFGILGMKWGIRRYQNKDGSLTNAGKKRYGIPSKIKPRPDQIANDSSNGKKTKMTREHLEELRRSGAIGTNGPLVIKKNNITEESKNDKITKLREKERKIRDRTTKASLEAVEKALAKHPETRFFKAEKNQLTKYIDEEAKSIKSLSDRELSKRNRGRKVGYTTAALIEIASAGSFAASLVMPLTPAGIAARSALGVTWVTSFLGGVIAANATVTKYAGDTSEYAKNIKEGKQWLGGKTLKYSGNQIAKAESKARESGKKSFTVSDYTSTGPNSGYWSTFTVPIALIDKYIED